MGGTASLLSLDAIIFSIGILIALIYIFKKTLKKERKWYILYTAITFSSMNIFIKPVHDYLIITPRTFLFYMKFMNYFSPMDIIFMILFIGVFIDIYKKRRLGKLQIFTDNFFSQIFKRDILLFTISFVGFFIFWVDNGEVDIKVQLRSVRLFLYGIPLYYLFEAIQVRLWSINDIRRTIEAFYVLNFINMLNQSISAYFLSNITWERNGWSACFLDQIDIRIYFVVIPFLLCPLFFVSRKILYMNVFIFILLLRIYMKSFYLVVGLSIIVIAFMSLFQGKIKRKIFVLFCGAFVGVLLFLGYIAQEKAILTRQGQLDMLFGMYEQHQACSIFGVGFGGMIKHQEVTEDGGEIRAIDAEQMKNNYTTTFQVPFFSFLKTCGIFGLFLTIFMSGSILKKCFEYNRKNLFFSAMSVIFLINYFMNFVFISADPQGCLYACEGAFLFKLVEKVNVLNKQFLIC